MNAADIWIGIIIPIFIGPICAYIMTLRNDYVERQYKRQREKYIEKKDTIYKELKSFYWPVYLNLLCIEQYSYNLPIKNKFRYESSNSLDLTDESNDFYNEENNPSTPEIKEDYLTNLESNGNIEILSDSSNNYEISIDIPNETENKIKNRKKESIEKKTIILDKKTLFVFENNLNKKYNELTTIIEDNMVLICIHQNLNMEIINFMKYAKVREIIHEGSPDREYNIEYFGVENNLKTLLIEIKTILDTLNCEYIDLLNNPV